MSVRSKVYDGVFLLQILAYAFMFVVVVALAAVALYAAAAAAAIWIVFIIVRWIVRIVGRRREEARYQARKAATAAAAGTNPAPIQALAVEAVTDRLDVVALAEPVVVAVPVAAVSQPALVAPTWAPAAQPAVELLSAADSAVGEVTLHRPRGRHASDSPVDESTASVEVTAVDRTAPAPAVRAKSSNRLATTGFVLGLVAGGLTALWLPAILSPVAAIPAIVFSSIGLAKARMRSAGENKSWIGLTLGAMAIGVWILQYWMYGING